MPTFLTPAGSKLPQKVNINRRTIGLIFGSANRKVHSMGGISIWQLLIVAAIVVLLFGTKKLRGMGGDLGSAIKGFKSAMKDEQESFSQNVTSEELPKGVEQKKDASTIEVEQMQKQV